MPVTASPKLASSPENRQPKGLEILVSHRAQPTHVLPQPASQPVARANCAIDPALRAEAATTEVKPLQSRSALPQAKPCANRVVTTRRQPVVTTREMPQPTKTYGGWRK